MSTAEVIAAVATILATLGVREVVAKTLSRKADEVVSDKVRAETAQTEVETLREVLVLVREDSASVRLDSQALREQVTVLSERVSLLEERERHQLTRAAVHEAWDQMAFQFLLTQNPDHPPPPPLRSPRTIDDDANDLVDYYERKAESDGAAG